MNVLIKLTAKSVTYNEISSVLAKLADMESEIKKSHPDIVVNVEVENGNQSVCTHNTVNLSVDGKTIAKAFQGNLD